MSVICYLLAGLANLFWIARKNVLGVEEQLIIPILTVLLLWLGTCAVPSSRRSGARRAVLWVILLYYLAILSALLFFGGLFHLDRGWGGAVNLEPFHTIRNFIRHYRRTGSLSSLSNLLGNVVLMIPLGILLPVMFRPMRRCWLFLPVAALTAVGVEYLQWRTATGVADVDDSILNFAGAAGAYILTRLCQMIYGAIRNAHACRISHRETDERQR